MQVSPPPPVPPMYIIPLILCGHIYGKFIDNYGILEKSRKFPINMPN